MDGSVAVRAALILAGLVAVVALALGAVLSREFFEDYGWAAGALIGVVLFGRLAAGSGRPVSVAG